MTQNITTRVLTFVVALSLVFGVVLTTPIIANAHDGEVHLDADATDIEKMVALIELLEQLVELLEQKAEATNMDATVHHETELEISAEAHGGVTHIHVYEHGKQTDAFFLEAITLEQETEIITAVAERAGYSEAEVEAAITFPVDEHAHDDESEEEEHANEEHEDEEMDLEGIHIMSDDTVMLGSGEVVADATVTTDGMIMLADGTMVEPEMDLR